MDAPGWLTRSLADVPAADAWLSGRERQTLAGLRMAERRAHWRLGRWTAKQAIAAWTGEPATTVEITVSSRGAPQALVAGEPARLGLSLSHRAGRAFVVVTGPEVSIGCDLELAEPRSGAFARTWLAPDERARVEAAGDPGRTRLANLIWAAKEAAAKARGEGLRLDVRDAVVELDWDSAGRRKWRPLDVRWERERRTASGWWREEQRWVLVSVGCPATGPPFPL
jgi:4'-phosphopantetheinyl transferase